MSSSVKIPSTYTINLGGGTSITVPLANVVTSSTIRGDAANPVVTKMTGDKDSPVALHLGGDVDTPITALLQGNPDKPIATQLQGDPDKPLATTMEILNLPRLSLEDIKDLMTPKLRIHLPNYEQLCFKLLGMEVWSLCLSGEIQAITEPYVPNSYEKCDDDCPDIDIRPFPRETPVHKRTKEG